MKLKAGLSVIIICVLLLASCNRGAGKSASAEQPQTQTDDTGGPGDDYDALPAAFGYPYTAILDGDISEWAGTWENGYGTSLLMADGVFAGGSTGGDLRADGFSRYDYGAYYWGVSDGDGYGGYGVMLYPPGVPINLFYMDGGERKVAKTIETDIAKVRIIAGQDGPESSAEVYYRKETKTESADFVIEGTTLVSYKGSGGSVIIPGGITHIGEGAFEGKGLTGVVIPDSVISIGDWVFNNNQLTSVTIGNSVASIGSLAFQSNQLTGVVIPDSVIKIGDGAFSGNKLTSVIIGSSVTSIGNSAFAYNQLTGIVIPNSVTSIGVQAFIWNQLTGVVIPGSVTSIGSSAFYRNQLTGVTIGDSVTSIGEMAFARNQLSSVTIPKSVTSINRFAFAGNLLNGKASFLGDASAVSLGRDVFENEFVEPD